MQQSTADYIGTIKTGAKQTYKNLTMVPLLAPDATALDYLTLDEALKEKVIEITEVSEGGHVPELQVINKAEKMVLLLDGEEVVGAKQNRIINTTILIGAMSKTVIPVSCVEQGRWSYRSQAFGSQERHMASSLRASKASQVKYCLDTRGTYSADQGAIWNAIDEKAARRGSISSTGAMSAIYEKDKGSIDEYREHFSAADGQTGAVFFINGSIAGLDSFGRADTFKKVFGKLLDSYALDAVDWYREGKQEAGGGAEGFLADIAAAQAESRRSVGLGTDIRFESPKLIGFALEHGESVLHLSAFAKNGKEDHGPAHAPMGRFSSRRRYRS